MLSTLSLQVSSNNDLYQVFNDLLSSLSAKVPLDWFQRCKKSWLLLKWWIVDCWVLLGTTGLTRLTFLCARQKEAGIIASSSQLKLYKISNIPTEAQLKIPHILQLWESAGGGLGWLEPSVPPVAGGLTSSREERGDRRQDLSNIVLLRFILLHHFMPRSTSEINPGGHRMSMISSD